MREHPGLIDSKKRKLLPLKNNNNYDKNKIFRIKFAHNSRSRSQKLGDPRDEEVDFDHCSVTFMPHETCLCSHHKVSLTITHS